VGVAIEIIVNLFYLWVYIYLMCEFVSSRLSSDLPDPEVSFIYQPVE
jgi:Na+-transporting methylmalonyl-CoA/oxaloacetate decarboxylase gamma subunit